MNKILVPVDFSENAENALFYAVNIAKHTNASITLLNAYKAPSSTGMFISVEKYMKEDAINEMEFLISKVQEKFGESVPIDFKCIYGETQPTIVHLAEQLNYNLILMGTKGASGLKEVFIGSVTSAIIKGAKTPVLAIPENFTFNGIKKIVLAVDTSGLSSSEILDPVREIAKLFDSEIIILHITEDMKQENLDKVAEYNLDEFNYSTLFMEGDDINAAVGKAVEAEQADLLCMVRRSRTFFGHLFHASVTSKEAFNSAVPLLVLHD